MGNTLEYKCPNCGGMLNFDSTTQKMNCPYCDSEIDIEALKHFDEKLKDGEGETKAADWESKEEWTEGTEHMAVYTCQNCGGEIIAEENTAAMHCPYCDNPVIFTNKLSGMLKPDYVIPFKLTKEDAKNALKGHLKGKPLLPKVFKSENHIDEIKGIYVPFWIYDADVDAEATFKTTRTRMWSDGDYNYTETSHYEVVREGSVGYEKVPADGSSQMPDDLMDSIEPFDFSQAVDFQTAYLSGYLADKYDVTAEDNNPRVQARMENSAVFRLQGTVNGYETIQMVHKDVHFHNANVKYALYPVYILNTSWKGEKYLFAMNGQTGKFVGNLPTSTGKFIGALAGLTAGFSGLAGLVMYLLANMN